MEDGAQASLTTRSMRARNRRQLLELLREHGALSQAEIARKTGLSRTTVSTLVAELRGLGVLVETDSDRPGAGAQGGRPPVMLALDDSAGAAVGVDVGLSHVRVAVANLARTVLAERTRELEVDQDAERALTAAAELVGESLAEAVALAVEGDPGCQRALGDVSATIGIAVGNVCNLLNPERVVVGGALSLGGELVLEPIRLAVRRATRQFTTEMTAVAPAELGDRAEVLGALGLVMRDASRQFSLRLDSSL